MSQFKFSNYFFAMSIFTSMIIATTPEKNQEPFVTFPSKIELEQSLRDAFLEKFVEQSDILQIVDQNLTPEEVVNKVKSAASTVICRVQDERKYDSACFLRWAEAIHSQELEVLKIILQKDPKALEKLMSKGFCSPDTTRHRRGGHRA